MTTSYDPQVEEFVTKLMKMQPKETSRLSPEAEAEAEAIYKEVMELELEGDEEFLVDLDYLSLLK